jgi:hypothetical protein
MAGAAVLKTNLKITGLGSDQEFDNTVTLTVPVETQSGYTIVATATTTAIQLFDMVDHIALAKIYGVLIKAEVGTIYITVDTAGTGTIGSASADLVLNVGESCYIPVNPGGNLGMLIDAAAVTDAFSWTILGKA